MISRPLALSGLTVFLIASASAQTTLNPDVSLVGDIRAYGHNDSERPLESERLNLSDPEIELMLAGYLNPYARADAVIAWHEGVSAEIEEIYVTFLRGLPFDASVRAGQYLLEFGRLNPVHPHAYSFVERPLSHREFFGHEGLRDMAARAAFLLPTGDAFTELSFAVLQGDLLAHDHGHAHGGEGEAADSAEATGEGAGELGYFGRLATSVAASEHAELALGVSGLTAIFDPHEELRAWLLGGDLKYKWKPSRYTSLTVEGEAILNHRNTEDTGEITSWGGYGYLDCRFRQRYNTGVIGEYTEGALHEAERAWRVGLFAGFAPVEETSLLRLAGHWTKPEGADGYWSVIMQLVFGLGPHQPHNF